MNTLHLEKLFAPASVALVGASPLEGSIGRTILDNLLGGGFKGEVYLVNPKHKEILGLRSHPSLTAIGKSVDLAVVAVPIAAVPKIIAKAGEAGIKAVIAVSAGGKETGEEGARLEREMLEAARRHSVRILGPNCLGIIVPSIGLNATFASNMCKTGRVAIISQSGAVLTIMLDRSLSANIGFSHFVSIGSMADIDFGDVLDYLGTRPEVESILLYIEALTNIKKFMSAARSVSKTKPIIVVKSGRSPAGAQAAASHTGSLVGDDEVYDAAFERAGIVRVKTLGGLFDCAEALAKQGRGKGDRLAVLTNAGGPGVMCVDAMSEWSLQPATLEKETIEALDKVLPAAWSSHNPVDILGDATPERYRDAARILLGAPEVDGLIIMLTPQAMTHPTQVAEQLTRVIDEMSPVISAHDTPVCAVWMGGRGVEGGIKVFNERGIPVFETPERAVAALFHMFTYTRNQELLQETPPNLPKNLGVDRNRARAVIDSALERGWNTLTEPEAKALLSAYGIPVNPTEIALSEEEAAERAGEIGYPVALKVHSPAITHKSDAGGIKLSLGSAQEVKNGYRDVVKSAKRYNPAAEILGVTLQPMVKRVEHEIILGIKTDPAFGPVILFGMGGIFTEIYRDKSIGFPPMNLLLARRMIEKTRIFTLLGGYRGKPPANLPLLEEIIVRLAYLAADFPEIRELDINPLVLVGENLLAVDARVIVEKTPVKSPDHLVILPYPNQYESFWVTNSGIAVIIRPIRPEDEPAVKEMLDTLSAENLYFRFFQQIKELGHARLAGFCQVDYDREIALVAVEEPPGKERILGMCHLKMHPGREYAELAVVIGERWQKQGLGRKLVSAGIAIAKEKGVGKITGAILPGNEGMLHLAKKLGFEVVEDMGEGVWRIERELGDGREN
ncbi:bifunctional acyl-CoA synthetase/GNAT family N-acetyltransferase [bacterium]|nr:MAG: bifunctional acyl-CoA synthetase/GNAT family N-acetyltransferase [bacterium]